MISAFEAGMDGSEVDGLQSTDDDTVSRNMSDASNITHDTHTRE